MFAGNGTHLGEPFSGPAVDSPIGGGHGLEVDPSGGVYLADTGQIRWIDPAGMIHHYAGFSGGFAGDGGPANQSWVMQPWDVALDRDGNVYIADTNNNRIRRVDAATGIITTYAGSGPTNGHEGYDAGSFCGDGGPATEACFNTPRGVAVRNDGSIFVADTHNQRIRRIDPSGMVSTFAESHVSKMVFDSAGCLFVSTWDLVMKYRPDGTYQVIAGTWQGSGFSGDGGPATQAFSFNGGFASGLDIDAEGKLFFFDANNQRIRAVRYGAVLASPDAQIAVIAGQGISAVWGRSFEPLSALVTDSAGRPQPSVRVDFMAPASGSTCRFADGENVAYAITDGMGVASITCTAAGSTGQFEVLAMPLASAELPVPTPASFTLEVVAPFRRPNGRRVVGGL